MIRKIIRLQEWNLQNGQMSLKIFEIENFSSILQILPKFSENIPNYRHAGITSAGTIPVDDYMWIVHVWHFRSVPLSKPRIYTAVVELRK